MKVRAHRDVNILGADAIEAAFKAAERRASPAEPARNVESEKSFRSVTEPISIQHAVHFGVDASLISQWASQLHDRRLLLLSSFDEDVLSSAAHLIAADVAGYYSSFGCRFRSTSSREAPELDLLLKIREGDPAALIIAEATTLEAQSFLDATISTPLAVNLVETKLREGNRLLMILTNDRVLSWHGKPQSFRARHTYIPYQEVSFLAPRLRLAYPDVCQELEIELLRQRAEGLWPQEEEAFHGILLDHLQIPPRLHEEIERRRTSRLPTGPETAAMAEVPSLSPKTPLESATLFAATFFPRLSARDNTDVIELLLGDRLQGVGPPTAEYSRGQGWVDELSEKKKFLWEIWTETYAEIFTKCQLRVQPAAGNRLGRSPEGGSRPLVVDFSDSTIRDRLADLFRGLHHPIFLDLFRRLLLHSPSLIYSESSEVANFAIRLIVETASSSPRELTIPLLFQLLADSRRVSRDRESLGTSTETEKPETADRSSPRSSSTDGVASPEEAAGADPTGQAQTEQAERGQQGQEDAVSGEKAPGAQEEKEAQSNGGKSPAQGDIPADSPFGKAAGPAIEEVSNRLYSLLRTLLQHSALKGIVLGFFEALRREDAPALVRLVWSLRHVDGFEVLPWLQKLLDDGEAAARDHAYTQLLQMAWNGGVSEIFPGVFGWLPDAKEPKLTSQKAACYFFVDFSEEYLLSRERRPGARVSENQFLKAAARDPAKGLEDIAVRWLFHEAVRNILARRVEGQFSSWIYSWLVPQPLHSAPDLPACMATIGMRWAEAGETLEELDAESGDALLFCALLLADWAVEAMSGGAALQPAQSAPRKLVAAVARHCNPTRHAILVLVWAVIEESLLDLMVFLEELDPAVREMDAKTVQELRGDLETRRRCLKEFRLDLQSHGRRQEAG